MTDPDLAPLDADAVAARLGLVAHPEGGRYRECFRSALRVRGDDGRERSASTAIYYLLAPGQRSAWHRVRADEVWHHYAGGSLRLYRLGMGPAKLGWDCPQAVVPADVWQAAEPETSAVLVGCTVAPGFEFEDFELADPATLSAAFPAEAALIARLS
ncbi:MAG: cupin domain-containing protein [Gemmatimonadales bacterium]|nr:cupin domain-containing protein [Gemmatimonadales bacterium]